VNYKLKCPTIVGHFFLSQSPQGITQSSQKFHRIFCHFDEGDSGDSEQAKQIFASSYARKITNLCRVSREDFSLRRNNKQHV
jgi:hypothetical protein